MAHVFRHLRTISDDPNLKPELVAAAAKRFHEYNRIVAENIAAARGAEVTGVVADRVDRGNAAEVFALMDSLDREGIKVNWLCECMNSAPYQQLIADARNGLPLNGQMAEILLWMLDDMAECWCVIEREWRALSVITNDYGNDPRTSHRRALLMLMSALYLDTSLAAPDENAKSPQTTQPSNQNESFYVQEGTDPAFETLLAEKRIPVGQNSVVGITGSKIRVNHNVLEKTATAPTPIPREISIHTLGNAMIPRKDFEKWSRWYQEDGNTQIFRLFTGEHNVRNERPFAARIESFSALTWKQGDWHEWEGMYTIVKPHGSMIFQVKNDKNDWAVAINLTATGDIILNHRRHQEDKTIASEMTGKSFILKVRDNGQEYEVFFNNEKVGAGHYDRPEGTTAFRWGMYVGKDEVKQDAIIFVTGATFR